VTLALHTNLAGFRGACDAVRAAGKRLGLVPTMGALHDGHMSLVARARVLTDEVALTLFVNPTQFAPGEDFALYPRDRNGDLERCAAAGVALVFAPETAEMYPAGESTRVSVSGLERGLCGRSRPGHFGGVATVVTKLFNAAGPCTALFGRKDYQQLKLVERLVKDLLMPVEVQGVATLRDHDGLAMSSRNVYLSAEERASARAIPCGLSAAVALHATGERGAEALLAAARAPLREARLDVEYVELADPDDLTPVEPNNRVATRALLAVAARVGSTRLIDNVVLGEDAAPLPRSDRGS
jgi:pantoate--beta-alanine ligase